MRVAVIGVGGVGSWCTEALLRSGVDDLVLVDDDVVVSSNLNRQCEATSATVGAPKVEAMKARLLSINPAARVRAVRERFTDARQLADFGADAIVDAIDSVDCKAELILAATEAGTPIFSSMGAALRVDPSKVALRRFSKVEGDALARALRRRFKKLGRFPKKDFLCAVSSEQAAKSDVRWARMTVTAVFGLSIASAVQKLVPDLGVFGFTGGDAAK